MTFKKKVFYWAIALGAAYFLLSYHVIFIGKRPRILKKSHLTLNYTFFSTHAKTNREIIAIDDLREDGIAEVLVDEGKMSEEQRDLLLERYGMSPEESY